MMARWQNDSDWWQGRCFACRLQSCRDRGRATHSRVQIVNGDHFPEDNEYSFTHQLIVLLGWRYDGGHVGHQQLLCAVLCAGVVHLDHVLRDAQLRQPLELVGRAKGEELGVGVEVGAEKDDTGQHLLHKVVVHVAVLLHGRGQPLEALAWGCRNLLRVAWAWMGSSLVALAMRLRYPCQSSCPALPCGVPPAPR